MESRRNPKGGDLKGIEKGLIGNLKEHTISQLASQPSSKPTSQPDSKPEGRVRSYGESE